MNFDEILRKGRRISQKSIRFRGWCEFGSGN